MNRQFWLVAAVLTAAPSVAHAECEPSFGSASSLVEIRSPSPDAQQVSDRFLVEVRNTGADACTLRLGVGRDRTTASRGFPAFSLSGPAGVVSAGALPAAAEGNDPRTTATIEVPANGTVRVPYDVSFNVDWGMASGVYEQDLDFQLFDDGSLEELGRQRTKLSLDIAPVARVRFSGAGGGEGTSQLAMGPLSPVAATHSPPFAIRVMSTSAYRVELVSQNQGSLRRTNGPDLIPYELSLDGELLDLVPLAGDFVSEGSHTSATGKVHPVRVVIKPDATRHAGTYSDRVTVTITTF